MIKCCIFDLDGTVLDTIGTITHYVNLALTRFGYSKITESECNYFAGDGARKIIMRAIESKGEDPEGIIDSILPFYTQSYDSAPMYLTKPFLGIPELLSELKARGIKLAVLSNKPDFATRGVIEYFFPNTFDMVVGGREDKPLKPDPTVPKEILESLAVSPEQTAWIGDTSTDMKTGKNLGVRLNIGVPWGFRSESELWENGADKVAGSPSDILREVLSVD